MTDRHQGPDHLEAEHYSALGPAPFVELDLDAPGSVLTAQSLCEKTQTVLIGIDRNAESGSNIHHLFDVILTCVEDAPAPFVSVSPNRLDAALDTIKKTITKAPIASTLLCRLLRMTQAMSFDAAIYAESLAYSSLLGGQEFRNWKAGRAGNAAVDDEAGDAPAILVDRSGNHVTLTLSHPAFRNAMSAPMRDALFEALGATLDDPSCPTVTLKGEGACFSTGGALDEFGRASDLAEAHIIRTTRSCAALLHSLGDRAEVVLNGACIGSGLEIPMAAARRRAQAGTFVQLPELGMGLIPGAGGTVTLPRVIGRHRTCFLALSGRKFRAADLAPWGLVEMVQADDT